MREEAISDPNENEHENDQFEKDSQLISSKGNEESAGKNKDDELNLIATAILFMIAGYDTTAQTLSYAVWQLCQKPDIQEKLQNEIDETFGKADNIELEDDDLDYGKIQGMQYLDMFLHEVLRRYTPAGILPRVCTKDYRIRGTDIVIKKNQQVHIPIYGVMLDEKYKKVNESRSFVF